MKLLVGESCCKMIKLSTNIQCSFFSHTIFFQVLCEIYFSFADVFKVNISQHLQHSLVVKKNITITIGIVTRWLVKNTCFFHQCTFSTSPQKIIALLVFVRKTSVHQYNRGKRSVPLREHRQHTKMRVEEADRRRTDENINKNVEAVSALFWFLFLSVVGVVFFSLTPCMCMFSA